MIIIIIIIVILICVKIGKFCKNIWRILCGYDFYFQICRLVGTEQEEAIWNGTR